MGGKVPRGEDPHKRRNPAAQLCRTRHAARHEVIMSCNPSIVAAAERQAARLTAVVGFALLLHGAALAQNAMPVTVASPIAKRITQWDEYSGRFEAVQTVELRARVSGYITGIHFKDGEIIKEGDQLFTIDKRQYEISVETAQAEVERTKAQLNLQQDEVDRAAPLVRTGALTKREFDTRNANLAIARAQAQSADAGLRAAALNLEWTEVRAPISGRVSDRKVDIGNLVAGGTGQTTVLTTIVSQDPIHFVFEASESDFLRYSRLGAMGQRPSSRETPNPVRIKLADEKDWPHKGVMNFVDNQLNARTGTLRGRAVVDNKAGLFQPGLFGRLQLYGGEIDALLVPDSAIVSDQARKIVFVVDKDGVVGAKPVELGTFDDGLRVIRSGLSATDRVVLDGLANPMVRPGAKVVPQNGEIKTAGN